MKAQAILLRLKRDDDASSYSRARSSLEFVESAFRVSGRGVFWLLSFPRHCAKCPASPERPFFE